MLHSGYIVSRLDKERLRSSVKNINYSLTGKFIVHKIIQRVAAQEEAKEKAKKETATKQRLHMILLFLISKLISFVDGVN